MHSVADTIIQKCLYVFLHHEAGRMIRMGIIAHSSLNISLVKPKHTELKVLD